MLWPYTLKAFSEQLNVLNVDGDGITTIDKFAGTTTEIYLKNHHTRVYTVYVLYEIFQNNISGLPK